MSARSNVSSASFGSGSTFRRAGSRTALQAYALSQQHVACGNHWIVLDVDEAERWFKGHLEEQAQKKAAAEEERIAVEKAAEPIPPVVDDSIPVVLDELIVKLIDEALTQAALDILREKVENFAAAEKEKRRLRQAAQAEEENKAKARDDLKKQREKAKKDKERKEKAEMAEMKDQARQRKLGVGVSGW